MSGRKQDPTPLESEAGDPVAKVVPIADLSVDPGNLRTHDARSDSGIEASLKRFGPARSIVVDGKGVVRAGITDVLVVEPKPGQLVAVRRSDWSPSEATGYAISDNRLTDLSQFDSDGLAATLRALQDEDFDLDAVGFTDAEVDALFGAAEAEQTETFPDDSTVADDDDRFVAFKFGDYSGRVSREVYDSFVAAYQAKQIDSGEPMMDDVLRAWLDV